MSNKGNITKYVGLDYLRFIAVAMIFYDHLGASRNHEWCVAKFLDFFFNIPLGIIQDYGAFGVSIFFCYQVFLALKRYIMYKKLYLKFGSCICITLQQV